MTLSPTFKLVFLSVLGLTVLSMLVTCYMLTVGGPPAGSPGFKQWEALMTTCESTFKLGFGTIIGLVGGKAAA